MAVRLVALGVRLDVAAVAQVLVHRPALARRHRVQGDRATGASLQSCACSLRPGAGFTNYFLFRKYRWLVPKWHGSPPPEQRLPGTMIGSVSFVVACFWLAWTSYASVPWYVPGLALILLGYAFS